MKKIHTYKLYITYITNWNCLLHYCFHLMSTFYVWTIFHASNLIKMYKSISLDYIAIHIIYVMGENPLFLTLIHLHISSPQNKCRVYYSCLDAPHW